MSKTFTLSEAQTLVPVLDALVRRAREAALRGSVLDEEMQRLNQRIFLSGGLHVDVPAAARRRAEHDKAAQQTKSTIEEIAEIGAEITDLEAGTLELPCATEGRVVQLCWRLGETEILHWREIDDEMDVRRNLTRGFGRGQRLQ
ncbi:Uncharacterized conserved protein [Granulicella rosea]|uniref:Uncharacterized conserved protein n=1 Tax=Granulicella rosea TaxID=474952 RepID=A0A239E5W6_9BACT|nr:DUF2203 domain-containing protein [Granulicella rosea]SNS39322.1 Uncharacterized conserved protein [Granulicella rosea]